MKEREPVRLGLMGCGTVATYGHIPTIMKSEQFDLVALFEPDPVRAKQVGSSTGIPVYLDEESFFQASFDAVVITSPAPFHYANVLSAARHGKHVLCEKPLAMNEQEAGEMIDRMQAADLMLFTAFDYRFSPAAQQIRKLVADGAIGKVLSLRLIYVWNLHGKYRDGQLNLRRVGRMEEGGPMVDCGVHQIDLARWWLQSDVVSHHAEGAWVDEYEAPDHMYLHLKHKNGAHTMVEISYSYAFTAKEPESHFEYHLIGTEGIIVYDRGTKRFELRNGTGTIPLTYAPEKNFAGMYDSFAQSIRTGTVGDMPTGYDGMEATRLARTATDELIRQRALESASK